MRTTQQTAHSRQSGFTLIEVMVAIGIVLVLFGLITINLGKTQSTVSVSTTVETLLSDIKHQQLLAMVGGQGSTSSQQPHGLYIQAANYTLFAGNSYSPVDSNNFVVTAPATVSLGTTFASNTILFSKGNGVVQGFVGGSNTITISGIDENKTITIGRFGALSVN